jgi:hypothetical protein
MSIKSVSIVAAAAMAFCASAAQAQVSGLLNGGFEVAANGPGEFADGWQTLSGATRTMAEAHSGSWSAFLTCGPSGNGCGQGFFQNSVDHGGLMPVDAANWGTAPTLSFWLKGVPSFTGNVNYALRYLSAGGAILSSDFGAKIVFEGNEPKDWFQITRTPDTVIPVDTAAVFFEMTLAAGPSGINGWLTPAVYVDDIAITLAAPPIPEPGTYALMLAGLVAVGAVARRRRAG